jgi:hypothetical protein
VFSPSALRSMQEGPKREMQWQAGILRACRRVCEPAQPRPVRSGPPVHTDFRTASRDMYTFRFRLARWVLAHRRVTWAFFVVVTAFFAAGLPKVQLETIFSDLLPSDDPFVQTFKDHPNFGNPLTVAVMIKRTDGNIYNAETIDKVWKFTRDIDLTPGVDHDLILSVTTEKARYTEATPFGIDMRPLMGDIAPKTDAEIAKFRERWTSRPTRACS